MNGKSGRPALTVDELLAIMDPGIAYRMHDLMARTGHTLSAVRKTLDTAIAHRAIECVSVRGRYRYRVIPPATRREAALAHPPGDLKGYDSQLKQFRAVCEASRHN